MLDLIRMDIARMRRMKALFWVPFLLCAMIFLTVYSEKTMYDRMTNINDVAEELEIDIDEATAEQIQEMTDRLDLKIDVFESFGNLVPDTVFALYLVIFAVLYACADFSTGFIKTIGGQVKRRTQLVASKLVGLFVFEVFLFALGFAVYTLLSCIFFKGVTFNDPAHFLGFMGVQLVLHFCLICFVAMVCIVARNSLVGMIIALVTVLGFFTLLAFLLDKLIYSVLDKTVHIEEYLLMENITGVKYYADASNSVAVTTALAICGVTALVSIVLSCLSMEKKDII